MNQARRLLMVVNDAGFFLSHRLAVARAAQAEGYEVHVATGAGPAVAEICAHGFQHHALPLTRSGTNPVVELGALWAMFRLFRRVRPDLVHLVTIKPVLYGGIAARLAGVPGVVAAVSGLGFVFIAPELKARLVRLMVGHLYHLGLSNRNVRVIFQNPADRDALLRLGVVEPGKVVMVRGSGVDLSVYSVLPEPDTCVVTMAARLLRDKGVCEFVEAARLLKDQGVEARFWLAGEPDQENPATISRLEMDRWRREGNVELLGFCKKIHQLFARSSIVALPSYYGEGLPKVLMEAAACGRAVVTTDRPGCRDAIEPGVTGLLVPPRDVKSLANAILRLLEDDALRHRMGCAGRRLAEREFAIEKIVAEHLAVYRALEHNA